MTIIMLLNDFNLVEKLMGYRNRWDGQIQN
mgnify:CR=1 FL=1